MLAARECLLTCESPRGLIQGNPLVLAIHLASASYPWTVGILDVQCQRGVMQVVHPLRDVQQNLLLGETGAKGCVATHLNNASLESCGF